MFAMAKFLVCIFLLVVAFDFIVSVGYAPVRNRPTSHGNRVIPYGNQQQPIQPDRAAPRATCKISRQRQQILTQPAMKTLPPEDGKFHLYALPVGQGSANVLQCPNGDIAIIDLGNMEHKVNGFWSENEIKVFLRGHNNRIRNIVITHNDLDHYSLFSEVFSFPRDLSNLDNIYISRTPHDMDDIIANWVNNIGVTNKLRMFNNGKTCGTSNGVACEVIALCPGDPDIKTLVLSANAGQCINSRRINKNIDSIVIEITFENFTMQLNGDLEDCSTGDNENRLLKKMADYYENRPLTVYMLAHHGAANNANKPVLLDAVQPKAVFASSNPWCRDNWRHPKCSIIDYLKEYLIKNTNPYNTLQQTYTCGLDNPNRLKTVSNNQFAIYTTTPSEFEMNLIHLETDGNNWEFINDIQQRIIGGTA